MNFTKFLETLILQNPCRLSGSELETTETLLTDWDRERHLYETFTFTFNVYETLYLLINDSHTEVLRLFLKTFIEIQVWLLLTFFICLTIIQLLLISLSYRCLKNVIRQIVKVNCCFFQ